MTTRASLFQQPPSLAIHRVRLLMWPVVLAALGLGLLWYTLAPAAAEGTPPAPTAPDNASDLFILIGSSDETEAATSLSWGDYDSDGDLDLAVGNYLQTISYPVRIYRNLSGVFSPVWASNETSSTTAVAWVDYDNDGDLDLAAGSDGSHPIRLYRNTNGVLTTSPYYNIPTASTVSQFAWGDINGDGYMDVVTAESYNSRKRLFINNGGVSFTLSAWTGLPNEYTTNLALADVDSDGDLDVATVSASNTRIYHNLGGIFNNTAVWSTTAYGGYLAWGDYDDDGDPDLTIGTSRKNIFRNDNGTLVSTPVFTTTETDSTGSVAWGDYDGDGDLDLLGGNFSAPARLYRNDDGVLTTSAVWSAPLGESTSRVAWGDFNGDGALDFALGGNILRYYQNAAGALTTKSAWLPSGSNQYGTGVAWADYDNDNDLDLAISFSSIKPTQIFQNVGGGLALSAVWTATAAENSTSLAWGDYDADGWQDLVIGNSTTTPSRLYRNNGNSTFSLVWSTPFSESTQSVAWADVDGDGDLDLAVGNSGPGATGQPNRLYRNDGGGATPTFTLAWSSNDNDFTYSVAWGDVDGDGDPDLMAGNSRTPSKLYRNDAGTLTPNAVYSTTASDRTRSVAWGDGDGDGDLDLAVANGDGQTGGQPNRVYRNDNGTLTPSATWSSLEADITYDVDWGDFDSDGDLDLVAANGSNANLRLYRNTNGALDTQAAWASSEIVYAFSTAWGDVDGDGDLDLASSDGVVNGKVRLYLNNRDARFGPAPIPTLRLTRPTPPGNANYFSSSYIWNSARIPLTYTLFDAGGDPVKTVRASFSPDGGGQWFPAVAASGTLTQNLSPRPTFIYSTSTPVATSALTTTTISSPRVIASTPITQLTDLDVWVTINHTRTGDLQLVLQAPNGVTVTLVNAGAFTATGYTNATFDNSATTTPFSGTTPVIGRFRPAGNLALFNGFTQTQINGTWNLQVRDVVSGVTGTVSSWGLHLQNALGNYVYYWDPIASGFLGQSDNVVVRLEAVPAISNTRYNLAGPYLYGSYASQTFPFRVRGTQVRVISNTVPVANALVYRLPNGATANGAPLTDNAGTPFRTDAQGYLQGRGTIAVGDRLMALLPITATQTYTLYFTSARPTLGGVNPYTITTTGVQTLTVTSTNPLLLFNIDVSLEWDAHNETPYLSELQANLQRVSEYLYDFSDGQVALGHINVFQNADEWQYAHVAVQVNNRLRPFALQGGIVFTPTADPLLPGIFYNPGQVTMGSVWNRYGIPGQAIGDDWAVILAHELGHYLLYHDDTYLGLDNDGNLIPVATCLGSAMGDVYDRPDNTEFISNEAQWQANCAPTLPERTLHRNEWETMKLWYPALITPTSVLSGPNSMPFDFTNVQLFDPYTPTNTLIDPTFYINYTNSGPSSAEARAYLLRSNYVYNLGAPFGGQNRVIARGATPGDRLCVFDRARDQFGCETIESGDAELNLKLDPTWRPILNIIPVNSTTLSITVSNIITGIDLRARLYPDLGSALPAITFTYANLKYSGVFTLEDVSLSGNIQLWVNEAATELNPRREALSAYSIGGNPGALRVGGGATRGGGGALRVGGGALRVGGGALRVGGAPVVSPDGQMIFFAEDPTAFITGTFFMIQEMPGLPTLPLGRVVVGRGYQLVESPGVTLPVGSISIQYLSNEVGVAGATENQLRLYFWDGATWNALPTTVDQYFNLATAPSEGAGVYALLASVELPLAQLGWNAIGYPVPTRPITTALASIDGAYTMVYQYVATDTVDPWKLFVPSGVPTYVVDLYTMEFGQAYWIYATMTTTLYLAPSAPTTGLTTQPPSTFYGALTRNAFFTPAPNQTLSAWVDGVQCGQTQTQTFGDTVVYAMNVTNSMSCNVPNRLVTFRLGAQVLGPAARWDNTRLTELNLSAPTLYLPVVMR